MHKPGYVYLICDPQKEYYKIGVTTGSIQNRMKKLQTGNGTELFIRNYFYSQYPFKLESLLHARYKSKKVLNEWFELTFDDIASFNETCDELTKTIECLKDNPFFFRSKIL